MQLYADTSTFKLYAQVSAFYVLYCLGLTLLKGFGFVQFESESVAQAAVNGERGSSLKGMEIGTHVMICC